jgi:hypothetical protein
MNSGIISKFRTFNKLRLLILHRLKLGAIVATKFAIANATDNLIPVYCKSRIVTLGEKLGRYDFSNNDPLLGGEN